MTQKILSFKHKAIFVILLVAFLTMIAGIVLALQFRQKVAVSEPTEILIPTGSSFEALTDTLMAHNCLHSRAAFNNVSRARKLPTHVKGGRYVVQPGMSLLRLAGKLRSGNQDAIRLTLTKYRTIEQLCNHLDARLEMQADSLLALLRDSTTMAHYGFTPQTALCLFVPNTYEIYWNTTPCQFLDRMHREYRHFWTPVRQGQCTAVGLSPIEVATLASIVEEETNKDEEKPLIASVYLNRLHRGMPLQADPTVKYAVGDFALRRILHRHLSTPSPYNTYINQGLPPGPICTPSIKSIDAVLENHKTNYLFFCAREDFSGYHNFATTSTEHQANAKRFHQALNRRGIK